MKNGCEVSDYDNILNESLGMNENGIYVKNLERTFDNDYFYFYYDNEEFGYCLYWRVFEKVSKRKQLND